MTCEFYLCFLDVDAGSAFEDLDDCSVAPSLEDLSGSFTAIGKCERDDLVEFWEFDLFIKLAFTCSNI